MALDDLISAWNDAFPVYVDGGISSSGPARPPKKLVNKLGQVIADAITTSGGGGGSVASGLGVRVDALEAINSEDRLEALESIADVFPAYVREMTERPGDAPELFSDAYTGPPDASAITTLIPATVANGKVLQVTGAHILARRGMVRIEPDRKYLVRGVAQRATDPADPLNDAVELGMAWFTNAGVPVSATPKSVMATFSALTVASGRTEKQAIVALASGDDITNVAPATTVYARAYLQSYGGGGLTNFEVLEVTDVTDSIGDAIAESLVADAIAAVAAVNAVESTVSGLRDDAVAAAASAGADLWSRPVASIVATEPGSPSIGDRVLLDGTNVSHPNQVAERFSGAWHYSGAPKDGQHLFLQSTQRALRYDGTAGKWVERSGKRFNLSDFATVAAAVTFLTSFSNRPSLWIDCEYSLAANTTWPVINLHGAGGKITQGTYTMTFPAGAWLDAPMKMQVFDTRSGTSGTITFTDGQWFSPFWVGAAADTNGTTGNGTDDLLAIQAAIDTGCNVKLPAGAYRISNTLVHKFTGQAIEGPTRVHRFQSKRYNAIVYADGNFDGIKNATGEGVSQILRNWCIVSLKKDNANTGVGVNYGVGSAGSGAGQYCLIENFEVFYFKTGYQLGATTTDGTLTTSTYDWRLNNTRSCGCQTDYEFNDCGGQQNLATKIVGETIDASYWLAGSGNRIGVKQNGGYVRYDQPRLEGTEYALKGTGNQRGRGTMVVSMPCLEGTRFAPFNKTADFQMDIRGGYGSNQGASGSNYLLVNGASSGSVGRGAFVLRGFKYNEFSASHAITALVNLSAQSPTEITKLEVLTTADGSTYSHPDLTGRLYLNQSGTFAPDMLELLHSVDGATPTKREYLKSWNNERNSAQIGDDFYTPEQGGGKLEINSLRNTLVGVTAGGSPFVLATVVAPSGSGSGYLVVEGSAIYNNGVNATTFVRGTIPYSVSSGTVTLGTADWSSSGSTVTSNTLMVASLSGQKIQITQKNGGGTSTEAANQFMGIVRHHTVLPRRIFLGAA